MSGRRFGRDISTKEKIMKQQTTLMNYDPATGLPKPYPSNAGQWRDFHGKETAWLFNPWTGVTRKAGSVGLDPFGYMILPPGEPICADTETAEREALKSLAGDLNKLRSRVERVLWPNSGMAGAD